MDSQFPITLGKSPLVPSVQELAKEPLATIPQRYVRPDQDLSLVVSTVSDNNRNGTSSDRQVPVINMHDLVTGDADELERMHLACQEWGFFQGLQIRKDGNWTPVTPIHPTAFIVNIGDILEIVTNGIYRSIEHCAVVNAKKERLSVSTFHYPGQTQEIGPAPSLVRPETPARFRKTLMTDFSKGLFEQELKGKSYLDSFRIEHVYTQELQVAI